MTTVAIFDDYLAAFSALPRAQQRKVRDFARKFVAWPGADSWRLERPSGMRDPAVRTVSIASDTSAVVLKPERSDLIVMLYAGRPDEVVDWARERAFTVHERTGAIQVYDYARLETYLRQMRGAAESGVAEDPAEPRRNVRAALAAVSDDDLLGLGVPRILLPAVRALRTRRDLDELGKYLPAEALERLLKLASGFSSAELAPRREPTAAPDDFERALAHPDSRRRFAVVRAPGDVEAMLAAPLEKWRLFLHPSQEELVRSTFTGPARVLGGAGTGKTVVAMHRARHLARAVFTASSDRVLFTTFTANLAQNLRELMASFCGPELARIETVNLHAWAVSYGRANRLGVEVASDSESGAAAYGRPEWEALFRAVRQHVEGRGGAPLYRAAVVDETQDFGPEELRLVRALVPKGPDDLFLVGDAHQRIYGKPVALSRLGIDVRDRTSTLLLNYRTTEQIRDWAVSVLEGQAIDDLDEGTDDQTGYVSLLHGAPPDIRVFPDVASEQRFLLETVRSMVRDRLAQSICIVARTHRELQELVEPVLREARLPFVHLERTSDREAGPGIRLATMHRVKGLEFPCVLVAGLVEGRMPLRPAGWESLDAAAREAHDLMERCLLYVASTRARDRLTLTAGGRPSPLLAAGPRDPLP
ncbi:MAG: AAA family ATPase [Candidatus Wallbacteria bacterium]|nr:AAA family ATPase [Candidatus Wallbacteria bacterium]